jgi:hypothetical protein
MFRGHPISDPRLLDEATRRVNIRKNVDNYTPEFAKNLTQNARLAPHLSPKTLMNLTAARANPAAVELMNIGAQELARKNDMAKQGDSWWKDFMNMVGNAMINTGRTLDNISNPRPTDSALNRDPLTEEIIEASQSAWQQIQRPYGVAKTVGQVALAGAETSASFINNYVFERRKDGTAPTAGEVLGRLGKVVNLITIPATYQFSRDEMDRAFKYTELGLLKSNWKDRGSGFFLSSDLQLEQMMSAFGLDVEGEALPDYRGRAILEDFTTTVPGIMAQGQPVEMMQPATLGGYLASAGWTGKRTANGGIVETRGMNIDSWAGSLVSGGLDAIVELSTDLTLPIGKLGGVGVATVKGARTVRGLSEAAQEAISATRILRVPGTEGLKRAYVAGQAIDEIPLTTKSWTEINAARKAFDDEVTQINARVADGTLSPAQRDSLISLRQSVLTEAETKVWDADKLSELIRTDDRWDFLFGLIDDAKVRYTDPDELALIIRDKVFKNRISLEDAMDLAAANGKAGYREIFLEAADEIRRGAKILPDRMSQLGAGKLRQAKDALGMPFERIVRIPKTAGLTAETGEAVARGAANEWSGQQIRNRIRNLFQLAPDADIVIDGSAGQRMASVDSSMSFLKNVFPDNPELVISFGSRIQKALTNQFVDIDTLNDAGEIVTKKVRAPASRAGIRQVEEVIYDVIETYLRQGGFGKRDIRDVISRLKDSHARLRTFNIDEVGDQTDFGMLNRLSEHGLVDLNEIAEEMARKTGQMVDPDNLQTLSAATFQELYNHTLMLPDWRALKQIRDNPLFKQRDPLTGNLSNTSLFVDKLITTWKQATLMNIGYLARNLLDGQAGLFLGDTGASGMFYKPFHFLRIVRNKAGVEDALNKPMTRDGMEQLAKKLERELTPAERNFSNVTRANSWGTYKERMYALEHLVQSGDVTQVSKLDELRYPEALVQATRKIHADPLEQIMAATDGLPYDKKKEILMNWMLTTSEGELFQSEMLAAYTKNGVKAGLPRNMVSKLSMLTKADIENQTDRLAFWDSLIDTQIRGRVETMAQVPELRIMMVHNAVPQLSNSGRVKIINQSVGNGSAFLKTVRSIPGNQAKSMDNITGAIYKAPDDVEYFVNSVTNSPSGYQVELIELVMYNVDEDTIAPISAWGGRTGKVTTEAKRIAEQLFGEPSLINNLPEKLPHFVEVDDPEQILGWWRKFVDKVFIGGFFRAENTFEKLPAYRQFKWMEYANNYGAMSKEALLQMEKNVILGAKRLGMSPDDYMGGAMFSLKKGGKISPYRSLRQAVKNAPDGQLGVTLEQVDQYAASVAESKMRQTFYDMPKKLNFETWQGIDVLFSFLAAQRSIMQRFARLMVANPEQVYRTGRAFNGATELDLPGDTDVGLVYRDPLTLQYKFRHPVGPIANLALKGLGVGSEGVTPIVGAPIRGLTIGLTGLPGVGPFAGLGLSVLMDAVANLTGTEDKVDAVRDIFLPFETLNKEQAEWKRFTPGWINKTLEVLSSEFLGQKSSRMQAEMLDAMAALFATGNYDTTTKRGVERLEENAIKMAQVMVAFGAASQLLGPAAGTPDYIIKTKGGDVFANAALAYYQELKKKILKQQQPSLLRQWAKTGCSIFLAKLLQSEQPKAML